MQSQAQERPRQRLPLRPASIGSENVSRYAGEGRMNEHAHGYGYGYGYGRASANANASADGRANNGSRASSAAEYMQPQKMGGSGRSRSYDGGVVVQDRRRAPYTTKSSTLPASQSQTLSYASVQSQLKARRDSEGGESRSKAASGRSKRESRHVAMRPKREPGEMFRSLPTEVLECVLLHLRTSHRRVGSVSCETCWLRDCCSLGLTCRKWRDAVKPIL